MDLTRPPTNEAIHAWGRQLMPGGVSSPVRSFDAVGGPPVTISHADGAHVTDVEGSAYIDLVSAYGAILLGHGHSRVAAACSGAAAAGLNTGAPNPDELRLAERLVEDVAALEWVRFVNSGTEAVMGALRLARAATGRRVLVTFDGCYHGHWDPLLVRAGSGASLFGQGRSAGVPESVTEHTAVLPLDDDEALDSFFDAWGEDVAAAIIEPVPANHGLLPQRAAFLQRLQRRCREAGALFVADEVVTGVRFGPGGAAHSLGLQPDLVTLGKVIGGGLPVGAYGGRAELRSLVSPEGPVYQAGTASGNAATMAAGNAVLDVLAEGPDQLPALTRRTSRFAKAATQVLGPIGARVLAHGPMAWLTFDAQATPRRASRPTTVHEMSFAGLHRAARAQGLLLPPSPLECLFPTTAHADSILDDAVDGLARAAATLENHP